MTTQNSATRKQLITDRESVRQHLPILDSQLQRGPMCAVEKRAMLRVFFGLHRETEIQINETGNIMKVRARERTARLF